MVSAWQVVEETPTVPLGRSAKNHLQDQVSAPASPDATSTTTATCAPPASAANAEIPAKDSPNVEPTPYVQSLRTLLFAGEVLMIYSFSWED